MAVRVFFFNAKDTNVIRATNVRIGRLPIIGGEVVDLSEAALECLDAEGDVVAAFFLNQIVGYSIAPAATRSARRTSQRPA